MPRQIFTPLLQYFQILRRVRFRQRSTRDNVWSTTVHLQRASRRNNDRRVRLEAAHATFDVAELLQAHVSAEASLSENVADVVGGVTFLCAGELQSNLVGENRRIAVCDVGERAGMNKDRRALRSKVTISCLNTPIKIA